jgi:hypothetical protein
MIATNGIFIAFARSRARQETRRFRDMMTWDVAWPY